MTTPKNTLSTRTTRDMKRSLKQVENDFQTLVMQMSIAVAYDNDALYPSWWCLRDYPNKVWFGDNITKDLRNSPVLPGWQRQFRQNRAAGAR